jgi:integrase
MDTSLFLQTLMRNPLNRSPRVPDQMVRIATGRSPLVRGGQHPARFFSEEEFRVLHAHLPDDLQGFCRFAYLTGWRRNEIRSLRWSDVEEGTIRLRGENAKNRNPRCVMATGELKTLLERRQQERFVDGVLTSFVFHRGGRPIGEFKKSWATACVAAGLGAFTCPKCGDPAKEGERTICKRCKRQRTYSGKIFHDFRRTAARNLIRSGVSQTVAMKIIGHKTDAMFRRYDITADEDLAQAMERVTKLHQATDEKVVQIAK